MTKQTVVSVMSRPAANEKELTISERLDIGLHILASLKKGNDQHENIKSGAFDQELCMGLYAMMYEERPTTLAQAVIPNTVSRLNTIKEVIAGKLEKGVPNWMASLMTQAHARHKDKPVGGIQNRIHTIRNTFNSQHAPAPEGSVKQLAAQYGVSIAEVRRLKAAGKLHELGQRTAQAEQQLNEAAEAML